jgi:transposase-like protein
MAEAERATKELAEAAVAAANLGTPRTRIRELAGVSASTLYGWLEAAGLEIRVKRAATKKGE